jgi:uncharacterized protein with HEPN domain
MRDDRRRHIDIQEAIEHIEAYAPHGQEAFGREALIQVWMLHYLQIIGEAARGLSEDFKRQHPEVQWDGIIGMRNVLVHRYFGIDKAVVWQVVQTGIPDLKAIISPLGVDQFNDIFRHF